MMQDENEIVGMDVEVKDTRLSRMPPMKLVKMFPKTKPLKPMPRMARMMVVKSTRK
jgi:hypothetical protein